MTLQEIKTATANLVFAQELADLDAVAEAGFYRALTRAIWVTDGLRPTRCILTLTHTSPFENAKEVGARDVLYDLRGLNSAIVSLEEPPLLLTEDTSAPAVCSFVLSGGILLYLPRHAQGQYRLVCRLRPVIPDETADSDTTLPQDEEICQILPLLIAHYLLLDDDTEKARHYLTLFREQYAILSNRRGVNPPVTWRSVNDW